MSETGNVIETVAVPRGQAAQYLRMSTEHQRYSFDHQIARIVQYAKARKLDIVRSYEDHGKSGLKIAGRPGLLAGEPLQQRQDAPQGVPPPQGRRKSGGR